MAIQQHAADSGLLHARRSRDGTALPSLGSKD